MSLLITPIDCERRPLGKLQAGVSTTWVSRSGGRTVSLSAYAMLLTLYKDPPDRPGSMFYPR